MYIQLIQPYVPGYRKPRYIDSFITSSNIINNATSNPNGLLNCIEIESDHRAAEVKIDIKCALYNKERLERYDFKKANWYGFWQTAYNKLSEIDLPSDTGVTSEKIDHHIMQTSNAIIESQKLNIPECQSFNTNHLDLPELTIKIKKNSLRRVLNKNPFRNNATQLKSHINCLNVMIKNQVQTAKDMKVSNTIKKHKKDQDIFKKINSITNRKPFPSLSELVESFNDQTLRESSSR